MILIALILMAAILSTGVLGLIERANRTGETFAQVTYAGEPIIKINLNNPEQYQVYQTNHQASVIVTRADEGIFYVPGEVTSDMSALYEIDQFAKDNGIVGIKLQVEDGKISVLYQESPRDLCQLEPPTNSSLRPIVCLPNKVVIKVITSETMDDIYLDDVLE